MKGEKYSKKIIENKEEFSIPSNDELKLSRRNFFKLMGASTALGGLVSCGMPAFRKPKQKIYPYAKAPQYVTPGNALYYATSMSLGRDVCGLIVKSHEGRPIKVEGNPDHPANLGKTNIYHQASVLDLYNPNRLKNTLIKNKKATKEELTSLLLEKKDLLAKDKGKSTALITEYIPSPLYQQKLNLLKKKYTNLTLIQYNDLFVNNVEEGIEMVTGSRAVPYISDIEKANVIFSFESDLLNPGSPHSIKNQLYFSKRRNPSHKLGMNRLYSFESFSSQISTKSDHKYSISVYEAPVLLAYFIFSLMRKNPASAFIIPPFIKSSIRSLAAKKISIDQKEIDVIVEDIIDNIEKSFVTIGSHHSPITHALGYILNEALQVNNKIVRYSFTLAKEKILTSHKVADILEKNHYKNVFILGGNISFLSPKVKKAISQQKNSSIIHLTEEFNETSDQSEVIISKSHYLEQWNNLQSVEGTISIVQPLINTLYDSTSELELITFLLEGEWKSDYDLLKTFHSVSDFKWRKYLHNGIVEKEYTNQWNRLKFKLNHSVFQSICNNLGNKKQSLKCVFIKDNTLYDGRFASNPWLQELPDPITKLTWDNAAWVSSNLAIKYSLKTGDVVKFSSANGTLNMPVIVVPSQHKDTVVMSYGYGRQKVGLVGKSVGFNITLLHDNADSIIDLTDISKTNKSYQLACVQDYHELSAPKTALSAKGESRPIYLETTQANYLKGFDDLKNQEGFDRLPKYKNDNGKEIGFGSKDFQSLWKERKYDENMADYQWGMTIDLGQCTGCNACTIACVSENNIPSVGKEEVLKGREMHWIRIDRYFTDDESIALQPVACMHCENAPCEQVCPVAATVHDEEGLNTMVYNRCIGTRYCANNCPYKVRKFNFFDYHQKSKTAVDKNRIHFFDSVKEPAKTTKMQFNPDVSVRMRGVMEKCTFCTQRLNEAKINIKLDKNLSIKDLRVQTACQQACPSGAIEFGNLLDRQSKVAQNKRDTRNYEVLAELNTKPRLSYLASVKNINPKLRVKEKLKTVYQVNQ